MVRRSWKDAHARHFEHRLQASGQRSREIRRAAGRHHLCRLLDDPDDVLFSGVLSRASATVLNIGADIWVMDPAVQTVANSIPMPDYVLDEVRSIPGVKFAVPLYSGGGLAKLHDGTYQAVNVMGSGRYQPVRPAAAAAGQYPGHFRRERLHGRSETRNFPNWRIPRSAREFELNDHRAKIVGHRQSGQQRAVRRSHALHDL